MYKARKNVANLAKDLLRVEGENLEQLTASQLYKKFFEKARSLGVTKKELLTAVATGDLTKISEFYERLDIVPLIPLREFVAYVETTLLTKDEEELAAIQAEFSQIFDNGLTAGAVYQKTKLENEVEPRNLDLIMHNQSPQSYRSVIELASNALDFSPPGSKVTLDVHEHGYTIRDRGKGLTRDEIRTKLLPPLVSGSRGNGVKSIGRFGIGFYTVGDHLNEDGDQVVLTTSADPASPYAEQFLLTYYHGEIFFSPRLVLKTDLTSENDDPFLRGTMIEILTVREFDVDYAKSLVKDFLRFKRGNPILVNGEMINDESTYSILPTEHGALINTEGVNLGYSKVLVNGVLIEKLDSVTRLVLDFPYTTELSESRDSIAYSRNERFFLIDLIERIFSYGYETAELTNIVNDLTEVIITLEKRYYDTDEIPDPLKVLSERAKEFFLGKDLNVLPDSRIGGALAVANPVYLHEALDCVEIKNLPKLDLDFDFVSSEFRLYVGNLNAGSKPIVIDKGIILVDRPYYDKFREDPILLELYINTSEGRKCGEFLQSSDRHPIRYFEEGRDVYDDLHAEVLELVEGIGFTMTKVLGVDASTLPMSYLTGCILNPTNPEEYITERARYRLNDDVLAAVRQVMEADPQGIEEVRELFYIGKPELLNAIIAAEADEGAKMVWMWLQNIARIKPEYFNAEQIAFLEQFPESLAQVEELLAELFNITPKGESDGEGPNLARLSRSRNNPEQQIKDGIKFRTNGIVRLIKAYELVRRMQKSEHWDIFLDFYGIPQNYIHFPEVEGLQALSMIIESAPEAAREIVRFYKQRHIEGSQLFSHGRMMFLLASLVNRPMAYLADAERGYVTELKWLANVGGSTNEDDIPKLVRSLSYDYQSPYLAYRRQKLHLGDHTDTNHGSIRHAVANYEDMQASLNQATGADYAAKLSIVLSNAERLISLPNIASFLNQSRIHYQSILYLSATDYRNEVFIADLLTFTEIADYFDAYSMPFSDSRLALIDEYVGSSVELAEMDRVDLSIFNVFLKRCLMFNQLTDEEFYYALPLLASDVFLRENDRELSLKINLPHTPNYIMTRENIQLAYEYGINRERLQDLFGAYARVYLLNLNRENPIPQDVLFPRLCEIWAELNKLVPSVYMEVYSKLSSSQPSNFRPRKFEYLVLEFEPYEVPPDVLPYALHLQKGSFENRKLGEDEVRMELETYDHQVALAALNTVRRFRSRSFWRALSQTEGFAEWVESTTESMDLFITKRAVLHAIYRQTLDPFAFLRELIQNSRDASVLTGRQGHISIEEKQIDDSYVVEVSDDVGMPPEIAIGYLLAVEFTNKDDIQLLEGQFGIGFMTVLNGAKKVLIQTGDGERTTHIKLEPIFVDGVLVKIGVGYTVKPGSYKGTVVQKFMPLGAKSMQSAFVEASAIRYASYLDKEEVQVEFNSDLINSGTSTAFSVQDESLGEFSLRSGRGKVITRRGFYLMDIPPGYYRGFSKQLRRLIMSADMVFEISPNIPVTRARNNIANQAEYLPKVMPIFVRLAYINFLQRFALGQVDFDLLPYDYFDQAHRSQTRDAQIESDAQFFNETGQIPDPAYYMDSEARTMYLLSKLRCIRYKSSYLSIEDLATMVQNGAELDAKDLPAGLKVLIGKARYALENRRDELAAAEKKNEIIMDDVDIDSPVVRAAEELSVNSSEFRALLEYWRHLATVRGTIHTIYYAPDLSYAHASGVAKLKGLNLRSDLASQMFSLVGESFGQRERAKGLLYILLNVSTHEDAHIMEGSDSRDGFNYTHSVGFRRLQLKAIHRLMDQLEIGPTKDFQDFVKEYSPKVVVYSLTDIVEQINS